MAIEILVRARDNDSNIPVYARWRRGDVVDIKTAPHQWGRLETLAGGFWQLVVPALNRNDMRLDRLSIRGDMVPAKDRNGMPILREEFRRKYFLNINLLPANVQFALNASGRASIARFEDLDLAIVPRTTINILGAIVRFIRSN